MANKIREEFEKWHYVEKWIPYDEENGVYSYAGIDESKIKTVRMLNESWHGHQMGYKCKKSSPWDMAPHLQEEQRAYLTVIVRGPWYITFGKSSGINTSLCSGYNCDPSRNGETRIYKKGEWIDE